ncbi:MAG: FtsB family cell division protein [Armatimonadota bacterium]
MGVHSVTRPNPERVPPRRRRPKRSAWRKTAWPLIKTVAICAVAVFVLNKIAKPFKLYDREHRETRQIALQLESLRKENSALERQIKYLKTNEGAAQAARELGWVKRGEITLVLPTENGKSRRK